MTIGIEKWLEVIEENKKLYERLLVSGREKVELFLRRNTSFIQSLFKFYWIYFPCFFYHLKIIGSLYFLYLNKIQKQNLQA